MDLKDHLAVTFGLIGKIILKDHQANVFAMKECKNGFDNECQYFWRTS